MRQFEASSMDRILLSSAVGRLKEEACEVRDPFAGEFNKIHESIELLRTIIPEVLTHDLIDTIYERAAASSSCLPKNESDELATFEEICSDTEIKLQHGGNEDRIREQNRIVAKEFCRQGYGCSLAMSTGSIKINLRYYEQVIFRVILNALEHLEQFLVMESKVQHPCSKRSLENMYSILIHKEHKLPPEIRDIFLNVIKGLHQITPYDPVTKQEAFILYKALQRTVEAETQPRAAPAFSRPQFKAGEAKTEHASCKPIRRQKDGEGAGGEEGEGREGEGEKEWKFELHKRWAPAYEELLLALYKKTANISQIRDRFQLVFPEDAAMFTVEAIRSKVFKILRVAIKKVQQLARQQPLGTITPLIRLDDGRVKIIINNHHFRNVRLLILDVYSRGSDLRLLNEAVNRINLQISAIEVQPRSERPNSRVYGGSSERGVVSPPFYHPFNHIPPKVRETRRKYNREYTPPAAKDPASVKKPGRSSGEMDFKGHWEHESNSLRK